MASRALEIAAERALFDGKIEGIIAPIYENERPLKGLAGQLDWRLGGQVSQYLRQGALSGRSGECAYVPIQKAGRVYHLILVGGGVLNRFAKRGLLPDEAFSSLRKNLKKLGLGNLALSRADFGGLTDDYLAKHLGEPSVWIAP